MLASDERTCSYCGRACGFSSTRCPRCGNVFRKEREEHAHSDDSTIDVPDAPGVSLSR